ncbi:MAG: thiol reductant ABC exporter subunit CydD [Pseudomonadota bacterium]
MSAVNQTPLPHQQRPEVWLISQSVPIRRNLAWNVFWAVIAGATMVLQARLLAIACHRLIMDHAALALVTPVLWAAAALALLRAGLHLLADWQAARAAATLKQHLRTRLVEAIQESGSSRLRAEGTGAVVEAATTGIEDLEPYVTRFLPQLAITALLPALILLVVLPTEWRTGLVLVFSAPFIPLLMVLIGRGAERRNSRQWRQLARMAGHFLDLVQGLPDLRIFDAAKREAAVVARVADEYRQSTMAVVRLAFLSALTLEFFSTVGTAVAAVLIGFQLLFGSLSLMNGLFILLLVPEFYLPFRTLGLTYHARMKGIAAAERLAPLLATARTPSPDAPVMPPPSPTAPTIRFDSVSCRQESGRGSLSGITLDLPAGSFTAVAGASGSGKSTLARLLAGLLQPEAGLITVDGVDLRQIAVKSWHSRMAWVSQRPVFFKGTIRENLLLAAPVADDRALGTALDAAGATPFLQQLPEGLDTPLGDRGAGLSGGELRRLAVARALLRNAALVVLDEPTAGLDRESELLVVQSIRRLAAGRTVLAISHREAVIAAADRVAVLHEGQLEGVYAPGDYLATMEATP